MEKHYNDASVGGDASAYPQHPPDLRTIAASLVAKAQELLNTAAALHRLSGETGDITRMSVGEITAFSSLQREHLDLPGLAKRAYKLRRIRDDIFDADLLGEPVWDILLDLLRHEGEGTRLSVTGACYGSGVAPTTALRWIAVLEDQGLIERLPDPDDKRRSWLSLTHEGRRRMAQYFKAALGGDALRP